MKTFLKLFKSLTACLFLPLSFAHADDAQKERTAQFMKAIVGQDIVFDLSTLSSMNNALFSLPDQPKLNYWVSAVEITRDFMRNPSQAEQKYGNAVFDVTGKISDIKNNGDDKSFVMFETSQDPAHNTIANLTAKGVQKAANYKQGQIIKLRCRGASLSTVVTLKLCQEMPPVEDVATKAADQAVNMFLAGENIEKVLVINGDRPASQALFFLYYIGSHYELNDKCFSRKTISQCNFAKYNVNKITASEEYKKAYEDGKKFYHLPEEKKSK